MTFLSDAVVAHLRAVADAPDLSGSRYRPIGPIGRGGMGTVWAAEDGALGREVAIKVLSAHDPDGALAARLMREARILARLEHPGIVPVHDTGRLPDGRPFYVMKRVRGFPLDDFLAAAPDRDARLRIFERVCETVAFAHARGVLHRDLKPGNIMVGEFGEVLVLDWGVAKVLGHATAALHGSAPSTTRGETTSHGTAVGTPGFMAPEQAAGDVRHIDARADVWGLGALLHVLLYGRAPAQAGDGRGYTPQSDVPRRLRAILDRALAPAPDDRYPDVAALAEDIRRFRTGGNPAAYREPFHERIARAAWKYRVPLALVLTYIVVRMLLLAITGR